MNKGELSILKALLRGPLTARGVASATGLSLSQVYRDLKGLLKLGFVDKLDGSYCISRSELGLVLRRVAGKYSLEALFSGSGLKVLMLLRNPQSIAELVKLSSLSEQSLYSYLSRLMEVGAVRLEGGKYEICDGDVAELVKLLEMRDLSRRVEPYAEVVFSGVDMVIKRVPAGLKARGSPTAFTLFPKYGVPLELPWSFYVEPPMEESVELALVHGLIASRTRRERTLCAVLYAKNRGLIDLAKARSLARGTPALQALLKLEAYASGVPIEEAELFLPWSEFRELASLYGVKVEAAPEAEVLRRCFEEVGENLERTVECYVFGGANLVMLGVKEATKDVDVALDSVEDYKALTKALEKTGFKPIVEVSEVREAPSMIYVKGDLRIDVFTHSISGLKLTSQMKKRAKRTLIYGNLKLRLISLEDVVLLKAISARERDLEDIATTAKKRRVNWSLIPQILLEQEEQVAEQKAVALLQAVEVLQEAYNIKIPRKTKAKIEKLALKHLVKKLIEKGLKKPSEISRELGVPTGKVRETLRELHEERGS